MGEVTLTSTARVSDDAVFREIEEEAVVLNLASGTYFGLDAVGTRIWQLIGEYGALRTVLDHIITEFDIDHPTAATDLVEVVRQLAAHGLVEIQP